MTTPDPELEEDLAEGQPEPENPSFQVSADRLNQLGRSAVHLIAGRLSDTSPMKATPVSELGDVRALIREVAKTAKNDTNYIRSDMPIQEIVFRTLLAGGNKAMSLTDLHYELTEKWATPIRPIVITEERLLRILDSDTYYGFIRVD